MIARIIRWSARNVVLVAIATAIVTLVGLYAVQKVPLDAIPDLSDVQVIVYTEYPGQAPQVVEDQVTYPITTAMLAVPGAKDVHGFSFFGDSYVYVVFEDGTDIYFARQLVMERMLTAREERARQTVKAYLLGLDDATLATFGYDRKALEDAGQGRFPL